MKSRTQHPTLSSLKFGNLLKESWSLTKKQYWPFLGAILLIFAFSMGGRLLPGFLSDYLDPNSVNSSLTNLFVSLFALSFFFQWFLAMNYVYIAVKVSRDNALNVPQDLFMNGSRFIKYLLGTWLAALIVFGGFILLFIPGIYFAVKLFYVPYLLLDKNVGIKESLKMSWRMTNDSFGRQFFYGLGLGVIAILGALPLFLGLFITLPLTSVAFAKMYLHLLPRTHEAN